MRVIEAIVDLHDELQERMENLEEGNMEAIEEDLDRLEGMINESGYAPYNNAPQNNAERRQRIRERFEAIAERIAALNGRNIDAILDAVQEIGEIGEPEFAEAHNLDHYEQELNRIDRMLGEIEPEEEKDEQEEKQAEPEEENSDQQRIDAITVLIRYILVEDQHRQAVDRLREIEGIMGQDEFDERMNRFERRIGDVLYREEFEEENIDAAEEERIMGLSQDELLQQYRQLPENQEDMQHHLFFRALREKGLNPYQLPNVGGRFNHSRKKHHRRKQKTFRNLLKKLK